MIQQPPPAAPHQFPTRQTSGLAITSLVCGLSSFLIPLIPSLIAIFCGHSAKSKIKRSNGALAGNGMALAGLICGYFTLAILTAVVGYFVYSANVTKNEIAEEIRRGKEIHRLVLLYEADHQKFPDTLGELVEKGYIASIDDLQPLQGGNWIYFQGLTSKDSSYHYIIRSDHHKVCIYVDGTDGSRDLSFTLEPIDDPMRGFKQVRE